MPSEDHPILKKMRADWNERAKSDAEYFIASTCESDPVAFRESGRRDVALFFKGLEHLLTPSTRVVDVGCGIGRMDEFVAECVAHVTGVDVSSEMVARARTRLAHLAKVSFEVGDGFTLRVIATESVDLVFSHIVFQHMAREICSAYVHDVHRVLVPGGSFVFQLPERSEVTEPSRGDPPIDDTWTLRFYTEAEARALVEAAGFVDFGVARVAIETDQGPFNQLRVHVRRSGASSGRDLAAKH